MNEGPSRHIQDQITCLLNFLPLLVTYMIIRIIGVTCNTITEGIQECSGDVYPILYAAITDVEEV